jgi:hypothetical protein
MKIQSLKDTPFEIILQCFFDAFADYFVDVRMPEEFWRERWKADRVDFQYSYGVFDQGQLVAVILNGIGYRDGKKLAFNAGTGVIPAYRGRRLVKTMYETFLPELKSTGIESCVLEVITRNTKAIKAYQSAGMDITRHYICFNGAFETSGVYGADVQFKKASQPDWDRYKTFRQEALSWGNTRDAIELYNSFEAYEMWFQNNLVGYFLIDLPKKSLAQFEVKDNDWQTWGNALFKKIGKLTLQIKSTIKTIKTRPEYVSLNK